jgi:hypothetical protein
MTAEQTAEFLRAHDVDVRTDGFGHVYGRIYRHDPRTGTSTYSWQLAPTAPCDLLHWLGY